jgi:hypothetical protein
MWLRRRIGEAVQNITQQSSDRTAAKSFPCYPVAIRRAPAKGVRDVLSPQGLAATTLERGSFALRGFTGICRPVRRLPVTPL